MTWAMLFWALMGFDAGRVIWLILQRRARRSIKPSPSTLYMCPDRDDPIPDVPLWYVDMVVRQAVTRSRWDC